MSGYFEDLDEADRDKLRKEKQPDFTAPMLATLTQDYFDDPDWIFERKFDGERVLAFRQGKSVRLMSRNEKALNDTYPEIEEALASHGHGDFIVDGEVVAFDGNVTSFARLQGRMQVKDREEARKSGIGVYYYVFDIIHLDGYRLDDLPLRHRKSLLRRALTFDNRIRFTPHRNEHGIDYHDEACRKGWEGVIAKDAASTYRHSRSGSWLKFKCVKGQELVIGGFTEPRGSRKGFGALLVGYYEHGKLRYAGKVGTGYDRQFLTDFRRRMDGLERKSPPFDDEVNEKHAHWIRPEIVGEFGFTEWTRDGKLRHPRFMGIRRDKPAAKVVRERPER